MILDTENNCNYELIKTKELRLKLNTTSVMKKQQKKFFISVINKMKNRNLYK